MWFFRFLIPINSFLHFSHLNVLSTARPIHARIGVRNVSNPCAVRANLCAVRATNGPKRCGLVLHMATKHAEQEGISRTIVLGVEKLPLIRESILSQITGRGA